MRLLGFLFLGLLFAVQAKVEVVPPNDSFLFNSRVRPVFTFYSAEKQPRGFQASIWLPRLKIFDDGHCVSEQKISTFGSDLSVSKNYMLHETTNEKVAGFKSKLDAVSPNLENTYGINYHLYAFSCVEFDASEGSRKICNFTAAPILYDELISEAYKLCGPPIDNLRVSHAWVQKWPIEYCSISPCPSVEWEGPALISEEGDWVDDDHWATEAFQATLNPHQSYQMPTSGKKFILSAHILGLSLFEPSNLIEHQPWGIPSPKSAAKIDILLGHSNFITDNITIILIIAGIVVAVAIFVGMYFIKRQASSLDSSNYELATASSAPTTVF